MKKLLLYPMHYDFLPILRFGSLSKYKVCAAAVPQGSELIGHDAAYADNGPPTGITVTDDFFGSLPDCDAILFGDDGLEADSLRAKLSAAQELCKEIIITQAVAHRLGMTQPDIKLLSFNQLTSSVVKQSLYEIPVPVVMVLGLGEQCNKFDLQLSLREYFTSEGYNVSQLGSSIYSRLFGFEALPDVFSLPFDEKVYALNYHIAMLAEEEQSDLIILGVPGETMPINEHNGLHFGEMALAMSHAVTPDVSVLSLYHIEAKQEYMQTMQNFCRYRFSMDTQFFHMSNTRLYVDQNHEKEYDLIKLPYSSASQVAAAMRKEGIELYHVFDADNLVIMHKKINFDLQNFPDVI